MTVQRRLLDLMRLSEAVGTHVSPQKINNDINQGPPSDKMEVLVGGFDCSLKHVYLELTLWPRGTDPLKLRATLIRNADKDGFLVDLGSSNQGLSDSLTSRIHEWLSTPIHKKEEKT